MLKIMNKNFDFFTGEQAKKIYFYLLEKFNQNNKNINVNIQEAMKSKEQIEKEIIEAIKEGLKGIKEDNFLKHSASLLFKDIIEVFKITMINKFYLFLNNLQKYQEIQNFFNSFESFEDNKDIKKKFIQYIEMLKKIERKSKEKAFHR